MMNCKSCTLISIVHLRSKKRYDYSLYSLQLSYHFTDIPSVAESHLTPLGNQKEIKIDSRE